MTTDTTSSSHIPSELELQQARFIIEEIATTALETDRLFYCALSEFDGVGDIERNASAQLTNLRRIMAMVGMLADVALTKIDHPGNTRCHEAVEEWLLPPVYPTKEAPRHG